MDERSELHLFVVVNENVFFGHAHDARGELFLAALRSVGLFDAMLYDGHTLMDNDDRHRFEKIADEMGFNLVLEFGTSCTH